jgi:peptidoglycan/xylan/chitin deacetylase (PgdA/CDA1 family)
MLRLPTFSDGLVQAEVERTTAFYQDCLGYQPRFFRPPYGELSPRQLTQLGVNLNRTVVLWNSDVSDTAVRLHGPQTVPQKTTTKTMCVWGGYAG